MATTSSLPELHDLRRSLLATLEQVDRAIAGSPPAPPCHLRRLPLELREKIYALAMFPQPQGQRLLAINEAHPELADTTVTDHHGYEVSSYNAERYHPPPLLQVCRQIRAEASKVFYSKVIFWKHSSCSSAQIDISFFRGFLRRLATENRELVKNIRLERVEFLGNTPKPFSLSEARDAFLQRPEYIGDQLEFACKDDGVRGGWRYQKARDLAR